MPSSDRITTEYAAIRYGSTAENSRYVKRDGQIIGAVCLAHDRTWTAYTADQILDMRASLASGLRDMAAAVAIVAETLKPGQSVDVPGGYIARSYSGSLSYYAEHLDRNGTPLALSPNFPTYDAAAQWLAARVAS